MGYPATEVSEAALRLTTPTTVWSRWGFFVIIPVEQAAWMLAKLSPALVFDRGRLGFLTAYDFSWSTGQPLVPTTESFPGKVNTLRQKAREINLELQEALERLSVIHDQVAKSEIYRGYRSWSIGASGLFCLAAAALQPDALIETPIGFLTYWAATGLFCGLVAASEIVVNYFARGDAHHRRTTRRVVGQLIPALVAGAAVSLALVMNDTSLVALLPGIWALVFSLGIFASRPYLPRATGYLGLGYLIVGTWLLLQARVGSLPSPWHIGLPFGIGQLLSALVLYWNLERVQE